MSTVSYNMASRRCPTEHAHNVSDPPLHFMFPLLLADLENWNGTDRFHFNAIVPDQDLVEVKQNRHFRNFELKPKCKHLFSHRPTFQHLKHV